MATSVDIVMYTNVVYGVQVQGKIIVTLIDSENDGYLISSSNNAINVAVNNPEKPTISITPQNPELTVTEGENFQFKLQAIPAPLVPIQVTVNAYDEGTGQFERILEKNPLTIGTDGIVLGTIVTRNNPVWVGHGNIKVAIESKIRCTLFQKKRV